MVVSIIYCNFATENYPISSTAMSIWSRNKGRGIMQLYI